MSGIRTFQPSGRRRRAYDRQLSRPPRRSVRGESGAALRRREARPSRRSSRRSRLRSRPRTKAAPAHRRACRGRPRVRIAQANRRHRLPGGRGIGRRCRLRIVRELLLAGTRARSSSSLRLDVRSRRVAAPAALAGRADDAGQVGVYDEDGSVVEPLSAAATRHPGADLVTVRRRGPPPRPSGLFAVTTAGDRSGGCRQPSRACQPARAHLVRASSRSSRLAAKGTPICVIGPDLDVTNARSPNSWRLAALLDLNGSGHYTCVPTRAADLVRATPATWLDRLAGGRATCGIGPESRRGCAARRDRRIADLEIWCAALPSRRRRLAARRLDKRMAVGTRREHGRCGVRTRRRRLSTASRESGEDAARSQGPASSRRRAAGGIR